ncbi:MAG TPA: metalloregulator ArsR/SmtB family transcription factor [Planctomycetota bacterium]|nr:metalloregulator ArsR/SmtB family transcription factor [Planctomycetota bacterium]
MNRDTRKLYEMKAEVIQAIAHPIRLAIVDFLADGEQCVCDIAAHVGAQRSNASRHLAVMLKAGVVDCRKDGLRVLYSLRTPCIAGFLTCVSNVLREQMRSQNKLLKKI